MSSGVTDSEGKVDLFDDEQGGFLRRRTKEIVVAEKMPISIPSQSQFERAVDRARVL